MKQFTIFLFLLALTSALKIESCPKIECTEEDVATDEDDWCMRVNYFDNAAAQTTVQIRRCSGPTKGFCEWGAPHLHQKFIWPFNQRSLAGKDDIELFDPNKRYEAKCVDASTYFGRT